jgi:peptidoglycan hydrolase CwlO-like protein
MKPHREPGLNVNFDSLNDVVTNLVGGLILLIVVVIGATTARIGGARTPSRSESRAGEEQPIDQLLERIRVMQEAVQSVEQDILEVQEKLPELAAELEQLKVR